jgi:hypothetical protein
MALRALVRSADGLLCGQETARSWKVLVGVILLFAPVYGAMMGAYAFAGPERLLQVLYSAAKVPMLLLVTTGLCLPGFFVLSTVAGVREDFRASVGAILSGQAAMSVTLASLAPVLAVVYVSGVSYSLVLVTNAMMFLIGTAAAQFVMRGDYRRLIARRPQHRALFWLWAVLYTFVGIQMGWTLRPFVGSPEWFPTFLRHEAFTNAYVEVWAILQRAVGVR